MLTVLSCLAFDHDYRFVAAAAVTCILGSFIAMRLLARVRRSTGARQLAWLFLASFLAGGTIWTTHFTAMLGYVPPVSHGYDAVSTFLSLFVSIGATFFAFFVMARAGSSVLAEASGALLGLGIAAMHYAGMAAYEVQGTIIWDRGLVTASLILAAFFGAMAMNRLARPVTRFCRYGSIIALVLAICTMHFTGMGAMTIVPDATALEPEILLPEGLMVGGVLAIMALIIATGTAIHFIDIQTQNDAVESYRYLALHDPLTALPNRTHLANRLETMVRRPADDMAKLAFLAFDLDRFKQINDIHGHSTGDMVLTELASRLNDLTEAGVFFARVGGDEFVALKEGIFSRSEAAALGERIRHAVARPIEYRGHSFSVGASIGIAIYPEDGNTLDELMSRADLAMYRAKTAGEANMCFFDEKMDEQSRSRGALALDLRQATERGELELYYQPQNDTVSRDIVGFEALLRWNHPERGIVPPAEFIPIAEETGLICDIGAWVLREACREAASWQTPYRIAVNVAPQQLALTDLPKIVHEALLDSGLEANRLELEITETGIIADQRHALHVIRQLKNLGVRIAMDDYGTGYSSLATLKTFPFDKIKIDRSFVDEVNRSPQAAAIVKATIILGSSLDIPVLAEGVESEDHLVFLNSEGCKEVQGYFFGKPMPSTALHALLRDVQDAMMREKTQPPLLDGSDVSADVKRRVA